MLPHHQDHQGAPPKSSMPTSHTPFQKVVGLGGLGLLLVGIGGWGLGQMMNNLPVGGVGMGILSSGLACLGIYGLTLGRRYLVAGMIVLGMALATAGFAWLMLHGIGQYGGPPDGP